MSLNQVIEVIASAKFKTIDSAVNKQLVLENLSLCQLAFLLIAVWRAATMTWRYS
jgi:hypothetical protein